MCLLDRPRTLLVIVSMHQRWHMHYLLTSTVKLLSAVYALVGVLLLYFYTVPETTEMMSLPFSIRLILITSL